MNDRELLEMAAKAAGITGKWMNFWGEVGISQDSPDGGMWNPLERDDLALRLAVKLRLHIVYTPDAAQVWESEEAMQALSVEPLGLDPYAATRRAIVRAAAAIGEKM